MVDIRHEVSLLLCGMGLLAGAGPASAQSGQAGPEVRTLSLEEAIRETLRGNPALSISRSEAEMARAGVRMATGRLLPEVGVRAGYLRSVDPVTAFGTKLRQGRFAAPDLAIDVLNDPAPITDWSVAAELRWSALDPVRLAERSASRHDAQAAVWRSRRARDEEVARTKILYFGAQGAEARLRAAEAAVVAARAADSLFVRRRRQGLLTRGDVLQAEAELRAAEARLSQARGQRATARERLALQLGWPPDRIAVPSDTLEVSPPPAERPLHLRARADVRMLASGVEAANARQRRADGSLLPALDGFAEYSSHAADALDSDATDWTVGLALRWNLFSGLSRFADRQRAGLEKRIAETRYEQGQRSARAEAERARREVASAWAMVGAMRSAASAGEEARRLVERRFGEGLATPAELLQAQARAVSMRAREVEARVGYRIALVRLGLATSASSEIEVGQ